MLLTADIEQKIMGVKPLFKDLKITISDNEKVAIIGRNGVGKTTLFHMLTGEDKDFAGTVTTRNGIRVVATAQEHHGLGDQTVVDYVLANLPEYPELKHIIDTFPETMGENMRLINDYSEALERFGILEYYDVEDHIRRSLDEYQLGFAADRPMNSLSGGQKRFVELIRVEHSAADLALIDEPTNHMDYVAKAAFIKWFAAVRHAVVVITHDRDLLQIVERIIDVKDQRAFTYPGNYDAYLKQNASKTANSINEFATVQRRLANVKKQIQLVRAKKASTSKTPNPFIPLENRLLKELEQLEAQERPSFWIDKESVANMSAEVEESYQKHKAKTIRIQRMVESERLRDLMALDRVQAGYSSPLFEGISLRVQTGDRIQIVGRNGAGKSTLVRTIMGVAEGTKPTTLLGGSITCDTKLRINTYEQELPDSYLDLTLTESIQRIYDDFEIPVSMEKIMRLLSDYLFDPHADKDHLVRELSGGQKARLQLMKLFANEPNLVILDEPTNHLDLPSIEELEAALAQYKGSLLYISHDSYLSKHLGGEELIIQPVK